MGATGPQPQILADLPPLGRYLEFDLRMEVDPRPALMRWRDSIPVDRTVVGIGAPLALSIGASVPGLRGFPGISGRGVMFPSKQRALWAFLAGSDATDLHDRTEAITALLGSDFALRDEIQTFKYGGGRDLTGFEDGTENPKGEKAIKAAIRSDGSSFVAVQRYVHDLDGFAQLPVATQSATIGRDLTTNEELPDAPVSAHVKRTAQESFDPEAFIFRRSMPWGGAEERGLYFVAFGESLDRFERQLRRMAGEEDGVVDALLRWTRAVSGGYYWCPPVRDGKLDLTALGL